MIGSETYKVGIYLRLSREDELKGEEDNVQKITDKFVDEIDKIIATKEKEIMQV